MKKIVALVLSLVMALSLATVAFAANYSDAYAWTTKGWEKYDLNGKAIGYTSATETKKDGEVVAGTLGYYTIDGHEYFVEVAKADATFQMKVDGKVVYLAYVTEVSYDKVGKTVKAGTKCGDYDKDVYGDAKLLEVGDDLYIIDAEDGDTAVLVDGVVKHAYKVADPATVEHEWYSIDGKLVTDTDADKIAEVKGTVLCKNCKVKATLTNDKGAIPTNATVIWNADLDVYMYWTDSADAGKTETKTDGISSPKTFDAGIAMYVGMSLLSVAGGAVVIGKKKEF